MKRTEQDFAAAEPPARRKLPIGLQTFREIREEGHYYVDKTPFLRRLMDEGAHYFLSRPRRFGKSLLLDTIKELFEGNEPLFRGLDVHDEWERTSTGPPADRSTSSGSSSTRRPATSPPSRRRPPDRRGATAPRTASCPIHPPADARDAARLRDALRTRFAGPA